jgi:hypothetical protein
MLPIKWRNQAWFDVIKLALAAFLFATPWIYGFTSDTATSRNAWACGIVIGLTSLWAIISYDEWEEWVSLLLGLWVLSSPWLLGFHNTVVSAMRIDVTLGIAIVLLSAADMWTMRHSPPHVTA